MTESGKGGGGGGGGRGRGRGVRGWGVVELFDDRFRINMPLNEPVKTLSSLISLLQNTVS